jgi:3-methyladenine DNA glycosylase AlkC
VRKDDFKKRAQRSFDQNVVRAWKEKKAHESAIVNYETREKERENDAFLLLARVGTKEASLRLTSSRAQSVFRSSPF